MSSGRAEANAPKASEHNAQTIALRICTLPNLSADARPVLADATGVDRATCLTYRQWTSDCRAIGYSLFHCDLAGRKNTAREGMMIRSTRRSVIGGMAAMATATVPRIANARSEMVAANLARYIAFGNKAAGGSGDTACGNWLAGELATLGYEVERQPFLVPYFDTASAQLSIGADSVNVYAQPIVIQTPPGGIEAPIVRVDGAGNWAGSIKGAIALVDLPYGRWSTLMAKAIRQPVETAFAAGAVAAVIITNGPTGKVIALNTDGRRPMFTGPVALIAPTAAPSFLAAAINRERVRLVIQGSGGTRPAFNLVGRIDRGRKRWLAISTPRSGWFTCGAERGGGIAAWLDLASWARSAFPRHDLAFICNTGHEYEYLGASEAMKQIAPPVAKTRFWLHLGANVAARDWRETNPPMPLPSVDPQRFVSITADLLPLARRVFVGQPGYEEPVSSAILSAGELDEVIKAGYAPAAGIFGTHRFHHSEDDDARCLNPEATTLAIAGFRSLLREAAARS